MRTLHALRFDSTRLEALWQASQASRRSWPSDVSFFLVFMLPTGLTGWKALQVSETLFPKLVYWILVVLNGLIVAFIRCRPESYCRFREAILAGYKLAVAVVICRVLMIEEPAADTWFQFARFELLLFQKGLIALILAVVLPQPFPWHCAVQSGMLLLFLAANPATCTAFHTRQPSNYGRYQQVVAWLDALLLPAASPRRRLCPLADCGQVGCMHVQALLNIAVGFVLPSLAVFAMERRTRQRFLLGRLRAAGEPRPPAEKRGRRLARAALCGANLCAGLALLWHWLGWLYAQRAPAYRLQPAMPPHPA